MLYECSQEEERLDDFRINLKRAINELQQSDEKRLYFQRIRKIVASAWIIKNKQDHNWSQMVLEIGSRYATALMLRFNFEDLLTEIDQNDALLDDACFYERLQKGIDLLVDQRTLVMF